MKMCYFVSKYVVFTEYPGDPEQPVGTLSGSERQSVAMARAHTGNLYQAETLPR